jgi:hypothetical protein
MARAGTGHAAGLPRLRALIRAAVDEKSLRDVADEVGMSHVGLQGFINGSRPHPATIKKLVAWRERGGRSADDREIRTAIEMLGRFAREAPTDAVRDDRLAIVMSEIKRLGTR